MFDFQHAFGIERDVLDLVIELRCDQCCGIDINIWLIVAIIPIFINFLITSPALTPISARKSPTLTTSDILIPACLLWVP